MRSQSAQLRSSPTPPSCRPAVLLLFAPRIFSLKPPRSASSVGAFPRLKTMPKKPSDPPSALLLPPTAHGPQSPYPFPDASSSKEHASGHSGVCFSFLSVQADTGNVYRQHFPPPCNCTCASPLPNPQPCFLLPIASIFSPRHSKTLCTAPAERPAGSGLGLLMVILWAGNTPLALIMRNEGSSCSIEMITPAVLRAVQKALPPCEPAAFG